VTVMRARGERQGQCPDDEGRDCDEQHVAQSNRKGVTHWYGFLQSWRAGHRSVTMTTPCMSLGWNEQS
jgi:hypothetical protein